MLICLAEFEYYPCTYSRWVASETHRLARCHRDKEGAGYPAVLVTPEFCLHGLETGVEGRTSSSPLV